MFRNPTHNARIQNPEAYTNYLKRRYFWNRRTSADVRKSLEYFQEAIRREPGYADAYAGLADSYIVLATNDQHNPREAFAQARAAVQDALRIDDSLSAPHAALGEIAFYQDWDWRTAEREFRRALDLNPDYATAHHWYALCLTWEGQFARAEQEIRTAMQLDPLSVVIAGSAAVVAYFARQDESAIAAARKAADLDPNAYFPRYMIGLVEEAQHRYQEARPNFEQALRWSPNESENTMRMAHLYAVTGDRVHALQLLDQLLHPAPAMRVSPYQIAVVYAGLGDPEASIDWLKRAYQEHDPDLVMLRVDRYFDALRQERRIQTLVVPR